MASDQTEYYQQEEEEVAKQGTMKAKRELVNYTSSSEEPRRQAKRLRVSPKSQDEAPASLASLPPELFCQVLSYIGPTSSSLLSLTQLNRYFHRTMKAIGNAMLPRACAHFRVPLLPKAIGESSTSLFIRHARACTRVLNDLTQLRNLLNRTHFDVTGDQVKTAMDLALNLLEIGQSLSPSLERQILSTCGKCGGKAFKYSKWRMVQGLGQATGDDVSPPALQRRNEELTQNEERLDMARLIMQIVVCRDWQLSKQTPSRLSGATTQKQANLKFIPTNWF